MPGVKAVKFGGGSLELRSEIGDSEIGDSEIGDSEIGDRKRRGSGRARFARRGK